MVRHCDHSHIFYFLLFFVVGDEVFAKFVANDEAQVRRAVIPAVEEAVDFDVSRDPHHCLPCCRTRDLQLCVEEITECVMSP